VHEESRERGNRKVNVPLLTASADDHRESMKGSGVWAKATFGPPSFGNRATRAMSPVVTTCYKTRDW
jgi:hypothetical protein